MWSNIQLFLYVACISILWLAGTRLCLDINFCWKSPPILLILKSRLEHSDGFSRGVLELWSEIKTDKRRLLFCIYLYIDILIPNSSSLRIWENFDFHILYLRYPMFPTSNIAEHNPVIQYFLEFHIVFQYSIIPFFQNVFQEFNKVLQNCRTP